ncbi:hypothetical protein V8D89_000488, partial [Ganoderma adspersum]
MDPNNFFLQNQPPRRERGHLAAYLTGARPDRPPPSREEYAAIVALAQLQQQAADPAIVDCELPLNTMDITQNIVLRAESLSTSLEPVDFIERVRLAMGVDSKVHLAYKWFGDAASSPAYTLATTKDVQQLFTENSRRKHGWRSNHRPIKISVINLDAVSRTAAARKEHEKKRKREEAEKTTKGSEEDAAAEFEHCRMKLRCPHTAATAGAKEVYCWTNPQDPLKRCQRLERMEVLLWARCMKNGEADRDCTLPPNVKLFDRLRTIPSEPRKRGQASTPAASAPQIVIHNHLPNPLGDIQPGSAPDEAVPQTGKASLVDSGADDG